MSLPSDDKARKALPIFRWLTTYFPDAIVELVRVSVKGNIQHNPELAPADIKWDRTKSMNQLDTAFRHMWDHALGTPLDSDECYHLAKAAWRNLAELQLTIEKLRAVPAGTPTATGRNSELNDSDPLLRGSARGLDGHDAVNYTPAADTTGRREPSSAPKRSLLGIAQRAVAWRYND